jgi:hypothetical protein
MNSSLEKKHNEKLFSLTSKINKRLQLDLDPSIEKNFSRLIRLLTDIEKSNDFILIEKAEMVYSSISKKKPNLELANEILNDLEDRLSINIGILNFLYNFIFKLNSPLSILLLGIGVNTLLGHLVVILGYTFFKDLTSQLNLDITIVLVTALAGGWGAVISIGVRLHNLQNRFYDVIDHRVLFLTGFFKPVIGVFFAIFAAAFFMSGFIPISIKPESYKYFFASLGFVSGFSERFAKDIITKAEKTLTEK